MATFNLIASSETFRTMLNQIGMVEPVDSAVLVAEETGTGQEGISHAIHQVRPFEPHSASSSAQRTANFSDLRSPGRGLEQEWHDRLSRLEQWISELLIKNEQLRMSLRLAVSTEQQDQDGRHVESD